MGKVSRGLQMEIFTKENTKIIVSMVLGLIVGNKIQLLIRGALKMV